MDLEDIALGRIDVSFRKNWDRPIHRWYRFHAGCSHAYPEKVLSALKVDGGSTVCDPFCGSGTILVSARQRSMDAIGLEVNPLYALISRVKTYWGFDSETLEGEIREFLREVKQRAYPRLSFRTIKALRASVTVPEYISRYFDRDDLAKLGFIKKQIAIVANRRLREFLFVALLSILMEISKVHHVGETIVFQETRRKSANVYVAFHGRLSQMLEDLNGVNSKLCGHASIIEGDARNLRRLVRTKIDHIITHPPYPNNYNYLLRDRLPLYLANVLSSPKDEKELRLALIGAVCAGKQFCEPVSQSVRQLHCRIARSGDTGRAVAVLEYFDSMYKFLENAYFILPSDGFCTMLVGNAYMRGVMIPTDRILLELAEEIGFKGRIFRVRNRGDGAYQHIYNGKLYESILVLN